MKLHGKVDRIQTEIVQALRGVGVCVKITSDLGNGFPDTVTAHRGLVRLMEIKSGKSRDLDAVLTPDQIRFAATWAAPIYVVFSIAGAFYAHGLSTQGDQDCIVLYPDLNVKPVTALHRHPMTQKGRIHG